MRIEGEHTTQDLFLPDAHLIIDQTMLLELVTELDQILAHGFHAISTKQARLRMLMARRK